MSYARKTQANILYYDEPKGRLERISNVTWLTTTCAQCGINFKKKFGKRLFEKKDRFYCNRECLNESQRSGIAKKIKENHFNKQYGTNNPFGSAEIWKRIRDNLKEKHGVENISQIPEIKQRKSEAMKRICEETDMVERGINTMKQKYGKHWLATDAAREHLRQYSQKKYGVDHPMQSSDFREKVHKACFIENYGVDNPMKIAEVVQKVRETCIVKYGVDNVFKREDVVENRVKKLLKNCLRRSSDEENEVHRVLIKKFGSDAVKHHIPIFYRKTSFWVIDFQVENVYVQYDGGFWHGCGKTKEETKRLGELGDRVAKMQYRALCKDNFQDNWFKHNNMPLFRILGIPGNKSDNWLPHLEDLVLKHRKTC